METTLYPNRAFKFAKTATPEPPQNNHRTNLLNKAFTDDILTREEKDEIAEALYGTLGAAGSRYRLMGWEWAMATAKQCRRILVSSTYEPSTFRTYWAPDKTSLRKALSSGDVYEMIYAPEQDSDNE